MQDLKVFYTVLHCIGEALFQTSVTYSLKQHGNICSYSISIVNSCTCLSQSMGQLEQFPVSVNTAIQHNFTFSILFSLPKFPILNQGY